MNHYNIRSTVHTHTSRDGGNFSLFGRQKIGSLPASVPHCNLSIAELVQDVMTLSASSGFALICDRPLIIINEWQEAELRLRLV